MTTSIYELAPWDIPGFKSLTAPAFQSDSLSGFDWNMPSWVRLPSVRSRPTPEPQVKANQLMAWTGMSLRVLAEVLGTTHPTLSALTKGQSTELSRRPEVLERLESLHSVAERLAPVNPGGPRLLGDVLLSETGGRTLADLAANGSAARAYIVALKSLVPRPEERFKASFATRPEGTSTAALDD